MARLMILLLLSVSITVSAIGNSDLPVVLVDSLNCPHIRCHWRGIENYCKPLRSFRKDLPLTYCGLGFDHPHKNMTDAEFIEGIKKEYPENTFTIDDTKLSERCSKKKRLCCNAERALIPIIENIQPDHSCSVQPMAR